MPSYTNSWNESTPAGTDPISLGDNEIRQLKVDIRERLNTDHWFPSADVANSGYHRPVHIVEEASDPTAVADVGVLYTKDSGGVTELFYRDSAGGITQLTVNGQLSTDQADYTPTKTGDWILATSSTARTGWTNVTATYTDRFIRINAGALGTGGTDTHTHSAGSFANGGHTHNVTSPATGWSSAPDTGFTGKKAGSGGGAAYEIPTDRVLTTDAGTGGTVSGTSGSANNIPAFVQVIIFQKT